LCILQASMAEEVVLFSNLDHVDECMCTSVLCVSVGPAKCTLFSNNHTAKTEPHNDNLDPPNTALHQNKMMGNLHVAYVHLQLLRLQRQSNTTRLSIVSNIPLYQSNVAFTLKENLTNDSHFPTHIPGVVDQRFIMFECGSEDISLRISQWSGYENHGTDDEKVGQYTACDMSPSKTEPTKQNDAPTNPAQTIKSVLKKTPAHLEVASTNQEASVIHTDATDGFLPLHRNASSCLLSLITLWLSLPAPPSTEFSQSMR